MFHVTVASSETLIIISTIENTVTLETLQVRFRFLTSHLDHHLEAEELLHQTWIMFTNQNRSVAELCSVKSGCCALGDQQGTAGAHLSLQLSPLQLNQCIFMKYFM